MNTSAIIAIVAVIVVLVVAVLALRPLLRRRRLQARFGPEYDRAVESSDSRGAAERDLAEREKQHRQLDLRPLSAEARDRYVAQWAAVQARFVDAPEGAVADADRLMTELMAERGYPTGGYDEQVSVLSVEHAGTLERYRTAHDIQQRLGSGSVPTEDLRNALVHYRALFTELLGPQDEAEAEHPVDGERGADGRYDGADARDGAMAHRYAGMDGTQDGADTRYNDGVDGRGEVVDGRRGDGVTDGRDRTAADADVDAELADVERGRTGRHQSAR